MTDQLLAGTVNHKTNISLVRKQYSDRNLNLELIDHQHCVILNTTWWFRYDSPCWAKMADSFSLWLSLWVYSGFGPPGSNWCFSFAPELVGYSAPRDLHRRAAYSICESLFLIHQDVYHDLFVCS